VAEIAQTDEDNEVHLADFDAFLRRSFDLDVFKRTALTCLCACSLACHVTQNKMSRHKSNDFELTNIACSRLSSMRKSGFCLKMGEKLCSIAFTFTGHRSDRRTTISPVGAPKQKISSHISAYSNYI
jgi:hypothetical protein